MPDIDMPEGQYFSLSGMIRAGTGGQTRALLMRNRLLVQRAGVHPILLTVDDAPVYPDVREGLRELGQLVDGMHLTNLFEHYRNEDLDDRPAIADELAPLEGYDAVAVDHPDGTRYKTRYVHHSGRDLAAVDYHRPDGSVYLRVPANEVERYRSTPFILVNADGGPVAEMKSRGALFRYWLRDLTPPDTRAFIISDSRTTLAHLVPLTSPRFHVLHLMHNTHTAGGRNWNSPLTDGYGKLLDEIRHLDGLVTLTDRQRQDVITRWGATNNLFVVPNPVDIPAPPEPLPERDTKRFVIVSRLVHQKRLEHAVDVFERVLWSEPDATLDIYGHGDLRLTLQNHIAERGLQDSVRLCGHDPRARETLWTATGFLMTSRFEGYPLASLESMSHGCPVVSYDVKYGPSDQIDDGVDGFLVPAGDVDAMAERVVRMIRSPELVARLSAAAREKAQRHDATAFLRDWKHALESAARQRPERVQVSSVTVDRQRVRFQRRARPLRWLASRQAVAASFDRPRLLGYSARLRVTAKPGHITVQDAVLSLLAVCDETGDVAELPVRTRAGNRTIMVKATVDPQQVFGELSSSSADVRLRLRLAWRNHFWQTDVGRPPRGGAPYEVSFGRDGGLDLHRGVPAESRTGPTAADLRALPRRVAAGLARRIRR